MLLSAGGVGTSEIMRRTGTSKTCVWRWQERFMREGVEGLLRDKTRPSRIAPLSPEMVAWVVARTREDPSRETTHWSASLMAREAGISPSSVHRIWRAYGLQPHRVRQFKLSNAPEFIDKLRDVVLDNYAAHKHPKVREWLEGRAGTMTHDYKRNGTTTQFAALNRAAPALHLPLYANVMFLAQRRRGIFP